MLHSIWRGTNLPFDKALLFLVSRTVKAESHRVYLSALGMQAAVAVFFDGTRCHYLVECCSDGDVWGE